MLSMIQKHLPAFVRNYSGRSKLFLLISCSTSLLASEFSDIADLNYEISSEPAYAQGYGEASTVRKPLPSLQVAGPVNIAGLASFNALNVKNGADFGGDVAIDGNLFVDGNITLDTCLVLTCTSAGILLANGIPVGLATYVSPCAAIPLTVSSEGYIIQNPGYYCLATDAAGTITISSSNVTLDLNNHTIASGNNLDGIDISINSSEITIQNGNIVVTQSEDFYGYGINISKGGNYNINIYDVNINEAYIGINIDGGTNFDITRVIVDSSAYKANGFSIQNAFNVILSECKASNSNQATGFSINGTASSSVLLNSCLATDGSGGFDITGANVTLTNCIAQSTGDGFSLDNASTDITLENCIANFNGGPGFDIAGISITLINCIAQDNRRGFYLEAPATNIVLQDCIANFNTGAAGFYNATTVGNVASFISCIAQNNIGDGFNMVSSQGSGTVKSCIAERNSGCGFNDSSTSSLYQYTANVAEGNGPNPADYLSTGTDTNYCLDSVGTSTTITVPGSNPFYQFAPNTSGNVNIFTPAYWNNITLQ